MDIIIRPDIWIKICGLKTRAMVDVAINSGADAVGLVFFPGSPRNISPTEAASLAETARARTEIVALTVDAGDAALDYIIETVRPTMLQLHGEEPPKRVADLKARYNLPILKAIALETAEDLKKATPYFSLCHRLLFDAKAPANAPHPGGNAKVFDWTFLEGLEKGMPYILSGGLTPDNVAQAVSRLQPWGLDVSSGVERSKGEKDAHKIATFIANARGQALPPNQPPANDDGTGGKVARMSMRISK